MKKTLSLILCLCLAVTLLMGLTVEAGAEPPPTSGISSSFSRATCTAASTRAGAMPVSYDYITQNLGGHIGKGYENVYGEGRIVSVNPES